MSNQKGKIWNWSENCSLYFIWKDVTDSFDTLMQYPSITHKCSHYYMHIPSNTAPFPIMLK